MKKTYRKPTVEVVEVLNAQGVILAGSNPENPAQLQLPYDNNIKYEGYGD